MAFNYKYVALAVVLVLTISVLVEYVRVKKLIAIGGRLVLASSPYEQHPVSPKHRVLFIGDSTGVGTGTTNNKFSLAGIIGGINPDADITNLSKNGLKSGELSSIIAEIKNKDYDLIVIHVGGNDIIKFKNFDQTVINIDKALSDLSPKTRQIALFTTGNLSEVELFPLVTRPYYGAKAKKLRDKMIETTQKYPNVHYVDLFNRPENLKDIGGYAPDKLHLSDKGYTLWHQALKDTLKDTDLGIGL